MSADGINPLLASLDWEELEERVRTQQRNREVHTPAISTFRWWARRSHALIGDLLDSAIGDSDAYCVGDPFSGGGTVAVEAARRGADVFAQDLHPWAIAAAQPCGRSTRIIWKTRPGSCWTDSISYGTRSIGPAVQIMARDPRFSRPSGCGSRAARTAVAMSTCTPTRW